MKTATPIKPFVVDVRFILLACAALLILLFGVSQFAGILIAPEGNDWYRAYLPAIRAMFAGHTPYNVPTFFNPPWVLLVLAPLALFPPQVGLWVVSAINLITFAYVARRFGAKLLVILFLLLTPQVLWGSHMGNIDWMIALGLVLPPQIGVFFVLAKPQIGAPIALFWLVEAWRKGGWRETIRTFAPVSAALILSFALFGLWPLRSSGVIDVPWNISSFPYTLPVGIALLTSAIRKHQFNLAILSSPFFSPYLAVYSLPVAVLGLLPLSLETIFVLLGLWFVFLLRGPT